MVVPTIWNRNDTCMRRGGGSFLLQYVFCRMKAKKCAPGGTIAGLGMRFRLVYMPLSIPSREDEDNVVNVSTKKDESFGDDDC